MTTHCTNPYNILYKSIQLIVLFSVCVLFAQPTSAGITLKLEDHAQVTKLSNNAVIRHFKGIEKVNPATRGYSILQTKLDEVEARLGVNLMQEIMQKLATREEVNILDWGCGEATALNEIALQLKHAGITNVNLYGLSDLYFTQWERNEDGITYIYGDYGSLGNHKLRRFDIVYSHYGLYHVPRKEIIKHFKEMRSMLNPGGIIVYNTFEYDPQALIDLSPYYHLDTYWTDFDKVQKLKLKTNGSVVFASVQIIRNISK